MLHTQTCKTPNGEIAIELKITCTKQHPTGITTSMLRAITASNIRYRVGSKPSDADFYIKLHVPEAPVWKKGGRKLLTNDQLEVVAEIYIKALADNMAPTKVIQTWGKTSRPTAAEYDESSRSPHDLMDIDQMQLSALAR